MLTGIHGRSAAGGPRALQPAKFMNVTGIESRSNELIPIRSAEAETAEPS